MAKKIEINENWEPVEVEDLDNLFVVIFKHGSFDQGYIEAFDTDDVLMQSAYDSLANQYNDCGCDELTKIYLIKIPNTKQTVDMCNTGLFNGNCCDPHVIEAVKDLYNRADAEQLACWEGCGLTEAKKKKKYPAIASSITYTTGDPDLNIKHFNKMMGTGGLQNPDSTHLVVGDTLPNAPVAAEGAGESAGDAGASGGEGGAACESLTEAKEENLEEKVREIVKGFFGEDKSRMSILEYDDGWDGFVEKFDEEEIDFGKFIYNDLSDEEIEEGRPVITFLLSGGLNGSGDWIDYLGDISKLFKEFKDKLNLHAIVYKVETDILDDVWTAEVLLYIDRDEVKESLNEDLIVIEPFEAKEKIEEIKAQIEEAKDWKVRKNLLTLMNVYLFQTLYESDHNEETDCNIDKEDWEDYSDWAKEQAEELYDEHPELEKEDEEREAKIEASMEDAGSEETEEHEELEEAVNYYDQVEKMKKLEDGTRGFNAKSASDEKLRVNRQVCIDYKLWTALRVVEDEMLSRGLISKRYSPKISVKISDYKLEPGMFILGSAKIIWAEKDNPQKLINDYGNSLEDLLIILVFALWMKEANLASAIKDHITSKFTVTVDELKDYLNNLFTDKNLIIAVKGIIHECCNESLEEDAAYSHKMMSKFELPSQIKLLDQKQVEDFVKQLAPEELFRIGYATPLYFYSELDDKFDLVKATEMEGYTGLDYRDASVDATDHDERVANAQRQIDTYADVLDKNQGHKLNTGGERFSTTYRATNKLALNPEKSNEYIEYELDDEGKPKLNDKGEKIIKSKIDMNKILFYPRVGSQPLTHYYVDFHNGQGFKPIKREVLVDTLYKFIMEVEKANAQGVSKTDLMWLQKKGYGKNIKKDSQQAIDAFYAANGKKYPIWAYRKAEEAGMSVEDYAKEHPYSARWSMSDFRKKATSLFDADAATIMAQDASTIAGKELAATTGANRTVSGSEAKPQVRALYSNQVYYLEGNPGKFGHRILHEELEEEVSLDEAKRYVKRYYVRPLNIFCGNKEDIIQALIRAGDQNCSVYSLKRLDNHEDVHLLQPSDIIYYWDEHVLYDKNHVQVMDYDLFVKHEEDRKKVGNVDAMSDTAFDDLYDDRATDADLKDKEVIANYKALNTISR